MTRCLVASWFSILFATASLVAQSPATMQDAVDLEVASQAFDVVSDEVRIDVRFQNRSGTVSYRVRRVVVRPDPALVLGGRQEEVQCLSAVGLGEFDLDPGEQRACVAVIPALNNRDILPLLAYRAKPRELIVEISYVATGREDIAKRRATFLAAPQAPLPIIILGSWLGVLFLIAFRYLYAWHEGPSFRKPQRSRLHIQVLFGWFVVTGAAVALRVATESMKALGVTFDVKDVVGGVVLGLMFEPLAKTIQRSVGDGNRPMQDRENPNELGTSSAPTTAPDPAAGETKPIAGVHRSPLDPGRGSASTQATEE